MCVKWMQSSSGHQLIIIPWAVTIYHGIAGKRAGEPDEVLTSGGLTEHLQLSETCNIGQIRKFDPDFEAAYLTKEPRRTRS